MKNVHIMNWLAGAFGAIATYAFGGWSGMLEIFFLALLFDYLTGVAASLKEQKGLSSQVGFWGLVKKLLMIAAVYFGHRVDLAFELNYIMMGLLSAFLANELISLAENYGRLGLPLSKYIAPIITVLKSKYQQVDTVLSAKEEAKDNDASV
ncbi:phage holin family protein [Paenibacillus lupini]|uniref:phage holin family protein n=1 Tax=Paenibacillus lupini TaxID=1450204 RepID=UPI001ABB07BC|nr:phage holin family protein [Paenibacillus lupini]NIK24207.1 toxin secretion/phage lysis holin [Paenibacillus lupini]